MEDKQKKYLEFILMNLVRDTKIEGNMVRYPFLPPTNDGIRYDVASVLRTAFADQIIRRDIRYESNYFFKFCRDHYGLSTKEILILLDWYGDTVSSMVVNSLRDSIR